MNVRQPIRARLLAALLCITMVLPATAGATAPADDDAAYATQLAEQFAYLGEHHLTFVQVRVTPGWRGREPVSGVGFEVTPDEASWLLQHGRQSELRAWGAALYQELHAHYATADFVATLYWPYTADTRRDGSVCSTIVAYLPEQDAWLQSWTFVRVFADGEVQVCAVQ